MCDFEMTCSLLAAAAADVHVYEVERHRKRRDRMLSRAGRPVRVRARRAESPSNRAETEVEAPDASHSPALARSPRRDVHSSVRKAGGAASTFWEVGIAGLAVVLPSGISLLSWCQLFPVRRDACLTAGADAIVMREYRGDARSTRKQQSHSSGNGPPIETGIAVACTALRSASGA